MQPVKNDFLCDSVSLRSMTAVYLIREGRMLLLYRVGSRVVAPSWCGIGGHFEPQELSDPRACVLRELREETGLTEDKLEELTLRYVTLRLKNGELRQNYYFFARLLAGAEPGACSEGELEWVPLEKVLERDMPFSAKECLKHYVTAGRWTRQRYAGVATPQGVRFVELEEF